MIRYNQFGVDLARRDRSFSSFVNLDPVIMEPGEMMRELDDKVDKGAVGVKIVPLDYAAHLDDPVHDPIFEYCQDAGMPILHPSGRSPYRATGWRNEFGHPDELAVVYSRFPRLKTCMAHLTHPKLIADLASRYGGVHADLSAILAHVGDGPGRLPAAKLIDDIRSIGTDRVLFGTNFGTVPLSTVAKEVETFRHLALSADEFASIGSANYSSLIGP
jgi:predicted TIM-barrel fold metal-dependent hydrolase